jgi:CRISPR-associated protein Csb2
MIRRVMIAEPFGADGSHTEWAARALHGRRLVGTLARDGPPEPLAVLEGIGDWSGDQVIPAFVMGGSREGSREWITTTPIVLPGYDGLDVRKAAKLMSRACDQAGLPPGSVESFEFTGPPRWSGGGRPFVPRYLRGLPMRHARITFREPVRGPAALGAGRHCGLGVLSVRSDPSS